MYSNSIWQERVAHHMRVEAYGGCDNAPMVFRRKASQYTILHLEATGAPLGLLERSEFGSQSVKLKTGDLLVMYTDGITEAENPAHELWGQERLETLLRTRRDHTPVQIVGRIVQEVLAFAKDCPQSDDMTLVVVGVNDEARS
jgi:phosphoserine phosphatase RsbU/P